VSPAALSASASVKVGLALIGRVLSGRASGVKMVGIAEMGAPISLDMVAVHPGCWCICLCYLHFAPENPEDGEMNLVVPAHQGCPGQSPESCKMVVCCSIITTFLINAKKS